MLSVQPYIVTLSQNAGGMAFKMFVPFDAFSFAQAPMGPGHDWQTDLAKTVVQVLMQNCCENWDDLDLAVQTFEQQFREASGHKEAEGFHSQESRVNGLICLPGSEQCLEGSSFGS